MTVRHQNIMGEMFGIGLAMPKQSTTVHGGVAIDKGADSKHYD
jgi:hypothetical protein